MTGFHRVLVVLFMSVVLIESNIRTKRGSSSISLGPPVVYKDPGNHSVEVGQDFQFYCKIKANPLAYVAMKHNRVENPITVTFPKYGTAPTGGSTIVLLDLMNLKLSDEGRYTCFAENKYGTVQTHGWLKFAKACSCNSYGVAFPQKPCDDSGNCVCRENVGGEKCDRCQEGFFNFPFCQPCECNPWGTVEQSLSCDEKTGECNCLPDKSIFDSIKCDGCPPGEFFNVVTGKCQPCRCFPDGSVSDECIYTSGKCECKENYTSDKCSQCKDGFYDRNNGCGPCDCVVENTIQFDRRCDSVSGQCVCKPNVDYTDSRRCASCPDNTHYDRVTRECNPCGCDSTGTERCSNSGECVCKENFTGINCDQCEENYYGFEYGYCEPCECNAYGTTEGALQCDKNGFCPCKEGQSLIDIRKCDGCPEGQTISQNAVDRSNTCEECECNPRGSLNTNCDLYTGECECKDSVYGIKCDECQPGSYGLMTLGECLPCNCDPLNSRSQQCDQDSGQCPCYNNIIFTDPRTCSGCPTGQYSKIPGTCEPCDCNRNGSVSIQCNSNGQCPCQPTVQGLKCDECRPGYFNFMAGGCEPCNCNKFGVEDPDEPCDPVTGQCNCKQGQDKISTRTCDGCPEGFYMNVNNPLQCFSCDCHPYGSTDDNCDLYTGQCDCGPNVVGTTCNECAPGFYGLNLVGVQECIPCECDPEGAESSVCDIYGQCQCKPGYGTINSKTCEGCPAGKYLKDGSCVPCGCDPRGSLSDICQADGTCFCGPNVDSPKCDQCESGFYFGDANFIGCVPCGCDKSGTIGASGECDTNDGQCNCLADPSNFFIDPRRCEPCDLYQYSNNNQCTDCGCHSKGSSDLQCDFLTGQCLCEDGAYGIKCDACEDGYFDLDQGCLPCNCDIRNTLGGDTRCDENGQCLCKPGLAYTDTTKCTTCVEGTYQNNGVCTPCECNEGGSVNGTCNTVTGQCHCVENVDRRQCDQCKGDRYGVNSDEGCLPCDCNINGTINRSTSCHPDTGQCDCIEGRTRYESRTCDGCLNNFFFNEFLDPVTRQCVSCDCLDVGSRQLNCSLYEGKCDCNPGIIGDKCATIAQARGDVVLEGDPALLSCALNKGEADRTLWIGPDGCESVACGHQVIEESSFMSLSYVPVKDEAYTCRFMFGDVVQDRIATVDVISFELESVRVQKGSSVTLTAVVNGMSQQPNRGIEWRHHGDSCTARRCRIDGHEVTDEILQIHEEWTLISSINIGVVQTSVKYSALFKYRAETFRSFAVVTAYECNCNPLGSKNDACDSTTLQCDCKSRYQGIDCDECRDEFYGASGGCAACNCDMGQAFHNVCYKEDGQCTCPSGLPFVKPRRCEKCPPGKYLVEGACVTCGCVTENAVSNSAVCADDGQCDCLGGFPFVDVRTCARCDPGTFLEGGQCVACGCHGAGSTSGVCDEETGKCSCQEHYKGTKCDTCRKELYGPSEGCLPCDCDPDDSLDNVCDGDTGQCPCIEDNGPFVDPLRCGACGDNTVLEDGGCVRCEAGTYVEDNTCTFCADGAFFKAGSCVACECFESGSVDNNCNPVSGACTCNDRFEEHLCDTCKAGYYSPSEGCLECSCVPANSLSLVCNRNTGQCRCNPDHAPFLDTVTCETCPNNHILVDGGCVECGSGQYVHDNVCVYCEDELYLGPGGECTDCGCSLLGASDNVCNKITGVCDCLPGYTGDKCDVCEAGYYMSGGQCRECRCQMDHTAGGDISCDNNGQCNCIGNKPYQNPRTCRPCPGGLVLVGGRCEECEEGTFISNYQCAECPCNDKGTDSCDTRTGACTCKPNFTGQYCDQCVDGFYSDECVACACSVNSLSTVCDKTTGACTCPDNFTGRRCHLCVDGFYGDACDACECDPDHSASPVCDPVSGQCECSDGFYRDPRTCEACPFNHRVVSNRCVPCGAGTELVGNKCVSCEDGFFETSGVCNECFCNPDGTAACNTVSGDCTCKHYYNGLYCDTCVDGRYDPGSGCLACECDPLNSRRKNCDAASGQCTCIVSDYLLEPRTCEPCPEGQYLSDGSCNTCPAGHFVLNNECVLCDPGSYLRFAECTGCRCNPVGSATNICDQVTGVCQCDSKHQGEKCQNCASGYYSSLQFDDAGCIPCECVIENTLGGLAGDPEKGMKECAWNGQCYCKGELDFVDNQTCETCPEEQVVIVRGGSGVCEYCQPGTYYSHGSCVSCVCNLPGSGVNPSCDRLTGVCDCTTGYTGIKCEQCSEGYYRTPRGHCVVCGCDGAGSSSDVCDRETGQCPCHGPLDTYADSRICFACPDGSYFSSAKNECVSCNCNVGGSSSTSCDSSGRCSCRSSVEGTKCDRCTKNHYDIDSGSGCKTCDCNPYGVIYKSSFSKTRERERDLSCHAVTGQCACSFYWKGRLRVLQNKYQSRTCDGCPELQYLPGPGDQDCVDCRCHPEGSKNFNCDLYSGNCECNPQIVGKRCDTRGCEWGLWEYGKECVITDFVKCRGTRSKTRKDFPSAGGDFSTITEVAECDKTESTTVPCRDRSC